MNHFELCELYVYQVMNTAMPQIRAMLNVKLNFNSKAQIGPIHLACLFQGLKIPRVRTLSLIWGLVRLRDMIKYTISPTIIMCGLSLIYLFTV